MRAPFLWVTMIVLALAPTLVAAEAPVTLISDASNDASLGGVPAPTALAAWELEEIVLLEESADAFVVMIGTAVVPEEAPPGEFGLHFRVGASRWLVGWTTIVFPAVPPLYRGGFYCQTDEELRPDVSTCSGLVGETTGEGYRIVVNRSLVSATEEGAVLDEPSAYAEVYNSDGIAVRIDTATGDATYTFTTGIPNGTLPVGEPSGPAPSAPSPDDALAQVEEESVEAGGSAPGFGWILLLVAAVLAIRRH